MPKRANYSLFLQRKHTYCLLLLISILFVPICRPLHAQHQHAPNVVERKMTLEEVFYAFPVIGITLENDGMIYDHLAPNEVILETEERLNPLSFTIGVPNLVLSPNQKGELTLDNINYVIVNEDGELMEIGFNQQIPDATSDNCRMIITIENGNVTITCQGSCPEEKPNCVGTLYEVPPEPLPKDGVSLVGNNKMRYGLTCRCEENEPEQGWKRHADAKQLLNALALKIRASNFETFAGTSEFILISGIDELIFSETGLIDKIRFKGDAGKGDPCAVTVIVENGQTTITCEGDCDEENPYCRMNVLLCSITPKDGEPQSHMMTIPKEKFKLECACKDS